MHLTDTRTESAPGTVPLSGQFIQRVEQRLWDIKNKKDSLKGTQFINHYREDASLLLARVQYLEQIMGAAAPLEHPSSPQEYVTAEEMGQEAALIPKRQRRRGPEESHE